MKKIVIAIIILSGILFQAKGQNEYYDYFENTKRTFFTDNFDNNANQWAIGNDDQKYASINNGIYTFRDIASYGWQVTRINQSIDISKDFEIEFRMKLNIKDQYSIITIFFGNGYQKANTISFAGLESNCLSAGSNYYLTKYSNNTYLNYIIEYSSFNLFTIRKVKDTMYLFYNRILAFSTKIDLIPVSELGFFLANKNGIELDFIKVSYLGSGSNVAEDNTAPEIQIYEPSQVGRGYKITDSRKEILVKGKATDQSGIYEIKINGTEARVDANNNFEGLVKLAFGDNTINVKATDTKNNSDTYTFYINRRSDPINQQIVVNENPDFNANDKRLALIIGNSNYGGGQYLKNPVNDANLMAKTLTSLGFEVIKRTDASKQSMEQAIKEYTKKLPNYNVALFYYAGHGMQVDGINYLIPTGALLNEKVDCKFEAISVNFIVEEFEKYPDNTNIVILDPCRNNPFRSWVRGGERGFKAIAPTSGTIIAFATSENATASDGTGQNGLFTQELVKQMMIPQSIENVFKKTRVSVENLSNRAQSPQEWTKLKGDFWFRK